MSLMPNTHPLAGLIRALPARIDTCRSIAEALIEVGRPLSEDGIFSLPTDFQRARSGVRDQCRRGREMIDAIRRNTLSPDLIRADAACERIESCCERCLRLNTRRLAEDEDFACEAKGASRTGLRFELNEKGQILEHE